ncbi:uncharacterized protein EDB91DRAFT_1125717 [Suillus paluster]|uniref:uncharacterized protein n=1 Tax=Suillus paluster TaxID=48578 RepID=UPI001B85F0E4|nr:uncharacterized protein EDB91DRAFT_1125717 [Suillus paluster]KAG1743741.1 hypothetical protein EDB91DRAFT_1125717 [Suillus paluster]
MKSCYPLSRYSCHGKQDCEQPYDPCFAMKAKPLTLLDIMENNAPEAEFAFLSACHTVVDDVKTPDATSQLVCSFPGSRVSLAHWVVDDDVTKHVVEAFYENIFKNLKKGVMDCTKAASALNKATDSVKKKVSLEQRIVFIHIGV